MMWVFPVICSRVSRVLYSQWMSVQVVIVTEQRQAIKRIPFSAKWSSTHGMDRVDERHFVFVVRHEMHLSRRVIMGVSRISIAS